MNNVPQYDITIVESDQGAFVDDHLDLTRDMFLIQRALIN